MATNFADIVIACCKARKKTLLAYLRKELGFKIHQKRGQLYAFRKGATPTSPLIVAHCDTVKDGGEKGDTADRVSKYRIRSLALDDRLGCAIMVAILVSRHPLSQCAFLVCDDEEIGQTSAKVFKQSISPNWMVELDRRGEDVVCYDYESTLFSGLLRHVGFRVGSGSFSDISSLDDLGCVGFNMGVGYHDEHSEDCYCDLRQTFRQFRRLERFYSLFKDIPLEYDCTDSSYHVYPSGYYYPGFGRKRSKSASRTNKPVSDPFDPFDSDTKLDCEDGYQKWLRDHA